MEDQQDKKKMKSLCSELVNLMEELQKKHDNPHVNFDEVRSKVTKEYETAKAEFGKDLFYPELVYKFYFISMMFEILTVYDVGTKLKEHYLKSSKEALYYSLETKR